MSENSDNTGAHLTGTRVAGTGVLLGTLPASSTAFVINGEFFRIWPELLGGLLLGAAILSWAVGSVYCLVDAIRRDEVGWLWLILALLSLTFPIFVVAWHQFHEGWYVPAILPQVLLPAYWVWNFYLPYRRETALREAGEAQPSDDRAPP